MRITPFRCFNSSRRNRENPQRHLKIDLANILLSGTRTLFKSPMFIQFLKANPSIQVHVSPRPNHHPIVRGSYINGREKTICVRNLEKEQILKKVEMLKSASGEKNKKVKGGRMVTSLNETVRGIWDPYHGGNKEIVGDRVLLSGRS